MAAAATLAVGAAAMSGVALGLSIAARHAQAAPKVVVPPAPSPLVQPAPPPPVHHASPVDSPAHGAPDALLDVHWKGFSMEEARAHADEGQRAAMARTPKEVLAELQRGNVRFWTNASTRPDMSAFQRRALISKQFPSVAVLSCADSRVPTEIVFDQGLGDLFVVRVAGNSLETSTKASLQYAVHHLKVKVLVVMGHEFCGAIKAAQLPNEVLDKEPVALAQALKGLKAGLNEQALAAVTDSRAKDREAVAANVREQVRRLMLDDGIMAKVRSGELLLVGAFYEISSGIVDFLQEVDG